MKKVLAISLALVLLVCFAACGGNSSKVEAYEGDLSAVIASIYEKQPVEFMTCEAMPVDLADMWSVSSYLGIQPAENATEGSIPETGIKEAFFSESMIGAQAYSLVVARVEDAEKLEEIKKAMFDGIDTRKWICVEADQLRVVSCKDIIMLVMCSSQLAPGLADGMVDAFAEVIGGQAMATDGNATSGNASVLSGEILTRG